MHITIVIMNYGCVSIFKSPFIPPPFLLKGGAFHGVGNISIIRFDRRGTDIMKNS